ncbi:hypothetical protein JXC34_01315 [Candidatus Woesearchaeota archaeon]|nr:hypothetical protein [Candidatus Woesearchaeota archaeon]
MAKLKLSDWVSNKSQSLNTSYAILLLIFSGGVWVLDLLNTWDGYDYALINPSRVLGVGFLILGFIVPILMSLVSRRFSFREFLLRIIYIWVILFIIGLGVRDFNSILHVILSLSISFSFANITDDKESFYMTLIILTLIDFFGFYFLGTIRSSFGFGLDAYQLSRIVIPIWVYFILVFSQQHNGDPVFDWIFWGLIVLNVLLLLESSTLHVMSARPENLEGVSEFWSDIKKIPQTLFGSLYKIYNQAFNDTYVDYSGTQEQAQDPQGVFIEELDVGDRVFREGSPVYVWAKLKTKTLDGVEDILTVHVDCYAETTSLSGKTKTKGVLDEEEKKFSVFIPVTSGVEKSIPCIFDADYGNELPEGKYKITYNVEFDFGADVRKKVYLMDRYRYINDLEVLDDKGLTPSKEGVLRDLYKIEDTDPESIASSGPVLLAIGTDSVPWDIGESESIKTLFGLTIKNLWESGGKVNKVNNIYLSVPDTFGLSCSEMDLSTSPRTPEEGLKEFKAEYESGHEINEIDDYRTIPCLMNVDRESLDSIPVTTRFLKAHVDYTYVIDKTIHIEVEEYDLGREEEVLEGQTDVCCKYVSKSSPQGDPRTDYRWSDTNYCESISDYIRAYDASLEFCEKECCQTGSSGFILVNDLDECNELSPGTENKLLESSQKYRCES